MKWLDQGFNRALAQNFVGNAANLGLFLATQMLLARSLSVADFGLFGALSGIGIFFLLVVSPLSAYISHGLSSASSRPAQARLLGRSVGIYLSAAAGFAVIGVIGAPWIQQAMEVDGWTLAAFGFFSFAANLQAVLTAALQGLHQFTRSAIFNGAVVAMRALVLGALIVVSRTVATADAFALYAVTSLPASLIAFAFLGRTLQGTQDRGQTATGASAGDASIAFPSAVATISIAAYSMLDTVLAKSFLGAHETGLYYAASSFGKLAFSLTLTFANVMLPLSAKSRAQGVSIARELKLVLAGSAAVGLGIAVAVALFPGLTLGIAFGKAYLEASGVAFASALAMTGVSILSTLFSYWLGRGDYRFIAPALIGVGTMVASAATWLHRGPLDIALATGLGVVVSAVSLAVVRRARPTPVSQ